MAAGLLRSALEGAKLHYGLVVVARLCWVDKGLGDAAEFLRCFRGGDIILKAKDTG